MHKLPDAPFSSSSSHRLDQVSQSNSVLSGEDAQRSVHHGSSTSDIVNEHDAEEPTWYSAISGSSFNVIAPQEVQLPTPRTDGSDNAIPFFPSALRPPESPLARSHSRSLGGSSSASVAHTIQPRTDSAAQGSRNIFTAQLQTVTPRTSPRLSPTSLPPRPVSLPLLSAQQAQIFVKTESPPPVLVPPHDICPSKTSSRAASPAVQNSEMSLSSPFVEKAVPSVLPSGLRNGRNGGPTNSTPLHAPTPSVSASTAPVLFSPVHIDEKPKFVDNDDGHSRFPEAGARQPGGELDRIRNHILSLEDARRNELESRRPDYLKRLQRGSEAMPSAPIQDGQVEKDSVGITATPAKGRRIQLFNFQETSAESFEESLMTHGYGTYGEPRTPHRPLAATEGLSQEAMDWLAHNTPAAMASSRHPHLGLEVEQTEKELKKRKRLEAFKGSTARAYAKLYPAEIEGLGRVLSNVPPEDIEVYVPPPKKRATGKKKKGAAAAEKKGKMQDSSSAVPTERTEPRWLDNELPWCLPGKMREEETKARDADRLAWIDKYLGHDTESDDEKESDKNDDDISSPPWGQAVEDTPDTMRRGRGKAVPLQANPNRTNPVVATEVAQTPEGVKNKSLFFPTDPADARTALMSKRSVRLLAQRKLRQSGQRAASLRGFGEGRLACACGRDDDDDGRPAVQCDDCYNWHHLECIGVQDEAELGEEDDPWFCPACTAQSDAALSAADWRNQRQPTFVPTDDRPVHSSTRSDVAFYSSSPLRDWGSSGSLHTPVQGQGRLHSSEFFRRSIWDEPHTGPGPSTPVRAARGVQVHTPGMGYVQGEYGQMSMFDPMISPRSTFPKFGTSFTTPKNNAGSGRQALGGSSSGGFGLSWPMYNGGLFATPTATPSSSSRGRLASHGSGGYAFGYGSEDPFGHASRVDVMYAPDDTPIRRAPEKEPRIYGGSLGSIMESPLAGRGVQMQVLDGPEGSFGPGPEGRRASASEK